MSRTVVCFSCVALLGSGLAGTPVGAAKPKLRRYDQGPLQLSEFRTGVREAQPFKAMTMTQVMYDFKFDWKQQGTSRYETTLKSLDAFAVFVPSESWWHRRARESLLDHEQGHFDIAEIAARRLQLVFRKAIADKKTIRGTGDTSAAAQLDLESKLKKIFEFANQQAVEENRQYDLQTRHGNRYSTQAEVRRVQLLTLKKLEEQLTGKKPGATSKSKSNQTDPTAAKPD